MPEDITEEIRPRLLANHSARYILQALGFTDL